MKKYMEKLTEMAKNLRRKANTAMDAAKQLCAKAVAALEAAAATETAVQLREKAGSMLAPVAQLWSRVKARLSGPAKRIAALFSKIPVKEKKQPDIKSALLQTYLTSLLCMVLCVSMFLGTSFAWFTSEVNNQSNEIYVGILEVELEKQDKADSTKWWSLSEMNGDKNKTNLFAGGFFWEPGYTALETIKVTNKGNLAFKYVLSFTEGVAKDKKDAEVTLADVAQYFDVWVYDRTKAEYTKPASYEAIKAENSGWENVGTLDELLEGTIVLSGGLEAPGAATVAEGTEAADHTYTIALHMKNNAPASVMGHKISLSVKLVAYQTVKETDGMGGGYDQMVATADELKAALANGGTVALAADVKLTEGLSVPTDKTVVLDLNGHDITMTHPNTANAADVPHAMITNKGTLTIVDSRPGYQDGGALIRKFDGATDIGKALDIIRNEGTLTVNGGTITNTLVDNQIGYAIDNYGGSTLTVNGGSVSASGSWSDGIRLFCGTNKEKPITVTVNGGTISSIWAQNPSDNKATQVYGTVILEGGEVTTTYHEHYTTVRVKDSDSPAPTVKPYYGDLPTDACLTHISVEEEGWTEYRFVSN